MLTGLYRKYIPFNLRNKIYNAFLRNILIFKRNFTINIKCKFVFFFGWILPKTEVNKAYSFMGLHGLSSIPYKFSLEYRKKEINVLIDNELKLPFVIHNNKRLYFPLSYSIAKIQKLYRSLIIEQDIYSPHRYVNSYNELKRRVLLDIGSAEGNFALDTIGFVDHAYLFECEEEWQAPLRATFSPWKEKVTIIKKYISDVSNETNVTIDEFLIDKSKDNLFIKMDIEGAEQSAIKGAMDTLKCGKNIHLAVCTYHRKDDPEIISKTLSSLGYTFEFTNGLIYWQKRLSKGVIRCHNQNIIL
jgi:hypothetical protein